MSDPTMIPHDEPESAPDQPETPSFETWLQEQPPEVRQGYERHTSGLRSALDAERAGRRDLERQIRQLARQHESGSDTRAQLDTLAGELATQNQRASFYEEAHRAGIVDLRLAYLASRDAGLIDERGRVDLEGLRARHPHLFDTAPRTPQGHAGAGTGGVQPAKPTMNDLIRRAAGRG